MRRIPIIIICLITILIPSSAGSWGPVMMSGGVAGGAGGCTTVQSLGLNSDGANGDFTSWGQINREWISDSFMSTSAATITEIDVRLGVEAGTPISTRTITCYVYAADVNYKPTGSALATSTNTVTGTIVQDAVYPFYFTGWAQSATTRYCVVLQVSGGDNSHYMQRREQTTGTPTEKCYYAHDGTDWSAGDTDIQGYIVTKSGTCP